MSTPIRTTLLASVLGWAVLWDPIGRDGAAGRRGRGLRDAVEQLWATVHHQPGDIPIVYDNATDNPVDVSLKVVNTGKSILFVKGLRHSRRRGRRAGPA